MENDTLFSKQKYFFRNNYIYIYKYKAINYEKKSNLKIVLFFGLKMVQNNCFRIKNSLFRIFKPQNLP